MILSRAGQGHTKPPVGAAINWAHPLARGLVFVNLLNEGSGRPRNLVDGAFSVAVPTWGGSSRGNCLIAPVGIITSRTVAPRDYSQPPFTTFALYRFSAAASYVGATMFSNESANVNGWTMLPRAAGTNNLWLFAATGSTNSSLVTTPDIVQASAISCDGSKVRFMHQGRVSEVTASPTFTVPATFNFINGGSDQGTDQICAYVWSRALSMSEMRQLYTEPFTFLLAQSPSVQYFLPAAGGGGDPEGRLIGGKLLRGGLLRRGVLVG